MNTNYCHVDHQLGVYLNGLDRQQAKYDHAYQNAQEVMLFPLGLEAKASNDCWYKFHDKLGELLPHEFEQFDHAIRLIMKGDYIAGGEKIQKAYARIFEETLTEIAEESS